MTTHAEGTFELKSFDEHTIEEFDDGTKLTRARIVTAMTGDLAGEATADNVMYYSADGTAKIVGFQRFVGRIGDRIGSFVLQTVGGYDGTEATHRATVVGGDGDFRSLRGEGTAAAPRGPNGSYTLDYELG